MSDDADHEVVEQLEDLAAHDIEVVDHNVAADTDGNRNFALIQCSNSNFFVMSIFDSAVYHSLSACILDPRIFSDSVFYGIMIDIGCTFGSSGG